ncbi:hypothetical protein BBO99_00009837 [Phytophthora kernoviae]|uniref:C2H2-type domain-containing protein n=1 Tax=Phytophthora kernoviae TaxID=325452 RepID=A0A3R7MNP4_9STRA|nr:hypothetical protein JM16_009779 [Phytophthora kernoviae]KAG2502687.1 hypothetical protein JM18_009553 [Phytophthora kernoviae]RLN14587.1 hypothetical protein BBI17_009895 [Phytophthora kernoviae]RLN72430.1 hypothetical protein BBO99_00009837 [Phytophthora kernoviae]
MSTTTVRPSMLNQPRFRDSQQDRPFECPIPLCGGRFHRKFTLHEHMKTHTGEQPHQCPVKECGKRFSTSGNLARHKRLHALHKMECPVTGCTRIFTSKDMLDKHQKVHNGNSIHTCVVSGCGKTFSTAGNLTRHMKTQHRSAPLPANSRISRQQQQRQQILLQQQHQQVTKVLSPTLSIASPCDEIPIVDFDMLTFLPPVEDQLQEFSFFHAPAPADPEALSDEDLKDLLESSKQ